LLFARPVLFFYVDDIGDPFRTPPNNKTLPYPVRFFSIDLRANRNSLSFQRLSVPIGRIISNDAFFKD
jgi:hypothetical protein